MDNKSEKQSRVNKKALVIFAGIIFLMIIIGAIVQPKGNTNQNNAPSVVETPPKDTSDLDLTVKSGTFTLQVTNNEASELLNCEVQVNPGLTSTGYNTRVDLISGKQTDIMYRDLTKGEDRFDITKKAVESVVVTHCNDQPDRVGIFTFE